MSIFEQIDKRLKELHQQELLFPIVPSAVNWKPKRLVMVTKDINDNLTNPPEDRADRFFDLRDDLRTFCNDDYVTPPQIKGLTGGPVRGVWELRSFEEEPQIRVLGHFVGLNRFVGLVFKYRDNLHGQLWNEAMREVREKWIELFPGFSPKTTKEVSQLFVGATHASSEYFRE